MLRTLAYSLLFVGLFHPYLAQAQVAKQKIPEKTRILFLLDASGSMLAPWEKGLRMNVAKEILSDLVDSLRINPKVELALRVYGHQYHRDKQNCEDTRLEIPFAVGNHDAMIKRIAVLRPQGTTPLAYSLEKAANDFPSDPNARNIIIIITDGIESCDGDPCAISLALQRKRIFLRPFVIGLGMDKQYEEQFACLGQFFEAKDVRSFQQVLNKALGQTLGKTTVSVNLQDHEGKPSEKDVNISFINSFTGEAQYDFVHYRYPSGQADSVEIDGVLSYHLQVNTIPPVRVPNVNIIPGRHNELSVKAPQGWLEVKQSNHTEYRKGVQVLFKNKKTGYIENIQWIPDNIKYLAGTYEVEVLTTPRLLFEEVVITPKETTTLEIPAPGLLNINMAVTGIGSVYEIAPDGRQRWILNLDENLRLQSIPIQPGQYKIVFRAHKALGSKFTEIQNVNITSGATVNIKLF